MIKARMRRRSNGDKRSLNYKLAILRMPGGGIGGAIELLKSNKSWFMFHEIHEYSWRLLRSR